MVFQCLPLLYLFRNVTLDNRFWNRASQNTNQKSLPKTKGWDYIWLKEDGEELSIFPHIYTVSSIEDHTISFGVSGETPNGKFFMFWFIQLFFKLRGIFRHVFPRNLCWDRFFGEKGEWKMVKQLDELYRM